jgi:hypothetical protein
MVFYSRHSVALQLKGLEVRSLFQRACSARHREFFLPKIRPVVFVRYRFRFLDRQLAIAREATCSRAKVTHSSARIHVQGPVDPIDLRETYYDRSFAGKLNTKSIYEMPGNLIEDHRGPGGNLVRAIIKSQEVTAQAPSENPAGRTEIETPARFAPCLRSAIVDFQIDRSRTAIPCRS